MRSKKLIQVSSFKNQYKSFHDLHSAFELRFNALVEHKQVIEVIPRLKV